MSISASQPEAAVLAWNNSYFSYKQRENREYFSVYTPFNGFYEKDLRWTGERWSYIKVDEGKVVFWDGTNWMFFASTIGTMRGNDVFSGSYRPDTLKDWVLTATDSSTESYFDVPIICANYTSEGKSQSFLRGVKLFKT